VVCNGQKIQVLSSNSPMGSLLLGRRSAEEFSFGTGINSREFEIFSIF
jgi:hypothetical protein